MPRTVAIGIQDFEKVIQENVFYVDKTHFIKEWWENKDDVTLIARPRRFGKTLNMSMLDHFFSVRYENQKELFQNLAVWKEKTYRQLAGTFPVISLSFARIKEDTYEKALSHTKRILSDLYDEFAYLCTSDKLTANEKKLCEAVSPDMTYIEAVEALNGLSKMLYKHHGKKVLIFLDEYDTPMQEAYVNGFWDEYTAFIRSLFNSTFKTNQYLERAVMTGITRVSKESIFSDLNNLEVVTTTSNKYATCFGLTEKEVFAAMDEQGLEDKKGVKQWYDGFTFGNVTDIYNPWSIINYLDKKSLQPYWANSSSNSLVNKLIREGESDLKMTFERLLEKQVIAVPVDEQIVYNQLNNNDSAIWSLLLATGYLKVISYQVAGETVGNRKPVYELALTNEEVCAMFYQMVSKWFEKAGNRYQYFIRALLLADLDAMNDYLNVVSENVFSYFDVSRSSGRQEPERFYHGFVLGLMVDLSEDYVIRSNRESGFGRYDVMLYRKDLSGDGIIMEFKVRKPAKEKTMEETVQAALLQIEEKAYAAELRELGFAEENIRKYGFAFEGKKVLIGSDLIT